MPTKCEFKESMLIILKTLDKHNIEEQTSLVKGLIARLTSKNKGVSFISHDKYMKFLDEHLNVYKVNDAFTKFEKEFEGNDN